MEIKPLINYNDIAKYRQLSESVDDDTLNQYILDAQSVDLAPLIGESIYNRLLSEDEKLSLLLNGGKYKYQNKIYINYGLKIVLAHYAYARYIRFGSYVDTPFSYVEKRSDYSIGVSTAEKTSVYQENRQIAFNYFENVLVYMQRAGLIAEKCCDTKTNLNTRFKSINIGR